MVLRELEAMNRLIDFIGHPEWSDLHVYAVMVISNCLEDPESIEVFLSELFKQFLKNKPNLNNRPFTQFHVKVLMLVSVCGHSMFYASIQYKQSCNT